jgi:choline/ethanolamine kinase
VYGVFPWGRIENFLDARTLATTEYASMEFLPRVSELLGKFHAQSESLLPLCTSKGSESRFEERLKLWYSIAVDVKFDGSDIESKRKQRKLQELDLTGSLKNEMVWLLNEIKMIGSPVVFSHCDLQCGNLLLHNGGLHMIDFEYSDRLERGFDLGNCFCEMSLDYKVSAYPGFIVSPDNYPDDSKQLSFLASYAKGAGIDFTNVANRNQLIREANLFAMGSHLHWAIWSVVQAKSSTIEFGYLEYAQQRMDQYLYFKQKHWDRIKANTNE